MKEKYTLEQIIDTIVQADNEVVYAIQCKDREMLQDVLQDYLGKDAIKEELEWARKDVPNDYYGYGSEVCNYFRDYLKWMNGE